MALFHLVQKGVSSPVKCWVQVETRNHRTIEIKPSRSRWSNEVLNSVQQLLLHSIWYWSCTYTTKVRWKQTKVELYNKLTEVSLFRFHPKRVCIPLPLGVITRISSSTVTSFLPFFFTCSLQVKRSYSFQPYPFSRPTNKIFIPFTLHQQHLPALKIDLNQRVNFKWIVNDKSTCKQPSSHLSNQTPPISLSQAPSDYLSLHSPPTTQSTSSSKTPN